MPAMRCIHPPQRQRRCCGGRVGKTFRRPPTGRRTKRWRSAVAVGDGSGNQVGARRSGGAAKKHRHRAIGKRVANLTQRIKKNVPARKFVFKQTWKTIE